MSAAGAMLTVPTRFRSVPYVAACSLAAHMADPPCEPPTPPHLVETLELTFRRARMESMMFSPAVLESR